MDGIIYEICMANKREIKRGRNSAVTIRIRITQNNKIGQGYSVQIGYRAVFISLVSGDNT